MFSVRGQGLTNGERAAIQRHHLGAVILFANNYSNPTQLARLTEQIQRTARRANPLRIGALISVDQEGGIVKRFPDMPPRYSAPEMGRINRKALTYNQGRDTGGALHRAGVNVDLAPVADLDLAPEHVMRSRSFGSNRYRAARLVKAFSKGLQSRKVAATLKHFPGLGGGTRNTDFGKSYVRRTRSQLRNIDAVPFHRAIDGGARLVMVSHAIYPHDGGSRPASLNPFITKRRLRDGFDFTGVAISDALGAVAWKFGGSTIKACAGTIRAGVDIALITGDTSVAGACARKIRRQVRNNRISQHRIDQAVERVLELKVWLGLTP